MTTTLTDMIAEARREVEMRLRVYPYRVEQKKMSQEAADRQIKIMADIAEALQRLQDNLPMFKELAKQKIAVQYPLAAQVLEHFPDAEITIRETQESLL